MSVVSGGRQFVAVGCTSGIYVSPRGREGKDMAHLASHSIKVNVTTSEYKKVLDITSPTALAAIQTYKNKIFNKFVVLHDSTLVSFSLDLIARVSQGQAEAKLLNASLEKIAGPTNSVVFFRHTHVGSRVLRECNSSVVS